MNLSIKIKETRKKIGHCVFGTQLIHNETKKADIKNVIYLRNNICRNGTRAVKYKKQKDQSAITIKYCKTAYYFTILSEQWGANVTVFTMT